MEAFITLIIVGFLIFLYILFNNFLNKMCGNDEAWEDECSRDEDNVRNRKLGE